ncbi:hypothetical protein KBD49_12575 [Myxococcota bacterium]|nr:hypothetical protein [Myxococcota bacterium]
MTRQMLCLFWLVVGGLWACLPPEEEGEGAVGVNASMLVSTCQSGAQPEAEVDRVAVEVTGRDRNTGKSVLLASGEARIPGSGVALESVPAGSGRVVTVLGYRQGQDTPAWYGRKREVAIAQDRTTELEMVLSRFGASTCVGVPGGFSPTMFPASVTLGDGRILLTGGFTAVEDQGGGSLRLTGPSDRAFLYDPFQGTFTEIGARMNVPRAGHAMVQLPLAQGDRVLIFGGVTKAAWKTGSAFPLSFDTADALDSYEIFDVAAGTFVTGKERMYSPRVFPQAGRLYDNSVLIAGGGRWPVDDARYLVADLWAPYGGADGQGGLLALGNGLRSNRQHNGGTMVKIEDTSQGLSRYLVVGGTTFDEAVVEVFTQSSRQQDGASGAFLNRAVAGLPRLYFPGVAPIQEDAQGNKRFLVAGGAVWNGSTLLPPADQAWLLTIDGAGKGTVEALNGQPCAARWLHGVMASKEGDQAWLIGGVRDFGGGLAEGACRLDLAAKRLVAADASTGLLAGRFGAALEVLPDDTLWVAGGVGEAAELDPASAGKVEVYTPAALKTSLVEM